MSKIVGFVTLFSKIIFCINWCVKSVTINFSNFVTINHNTNTL